MIGTTQGLIQALKPKTIIKFGSFKGGSAILVGDIQSLSVKDGKIISIDIDFDNIDQTVKEDNRIEFLQGD
ncbi:dihydrolipoamide acetyltransferase [Rickettsia canadensis str. McKiel]|uniref:Dihydrolipoamide acetyltransferase n=1 Tax=Rickettsia canadensis (strain McKiel) TaxID=293613 RepID=A8EXQ6_RICCK|nr:dihydrolipoamide acetyltransferase [Rickettsia canadensis]ABV73139.1 dihydrolipoamide acetyltransferase [Rickettsia canadensis str. McKiel]